MTGRKFLSPPLLWLAPQSDHGSAARAEAEAVFQYGPPQSDCGGGRLTPRGSIGAGGCAESILDQGNPKPGKGQELGGQGWGERLTQRAPPRRPWRRGARFV